MKKFLGKKSVFLSLLVTVVLFTGLYIYMLVRPVAYGFTYEGISSIARAEIECTFKSSKVVEIEIEDEVIELYYYQDDGKLIFLTTTDRMSEDEYEDLIEDAREQDDYEEQLDKLKTRVNAFEAVIDPGIPGVSSLTVKCEDSVTFAIVGGIVELAILVFAGLSTVCIIKKKKA